MKPMFIAALFTAALLAQPADATVWAFEITGNGTANFMIDTAKDKPRFVNNTGITYVNIAGVYNGVSASRYVQFFNNTGYGGFNTGFVGQGKGAMLYTGSPEDPVFTSGTFALLPLAFGAPGGYTITISELVAAVPEPETWAMMAVGMGAIGLAMRRRQRVTMRLPHVA